MAKKSTFKAKSSKMPGVGNPNGIISSIGKKDIGTQKFSKMTKGKK